MESTQIQNSLQRTKEEVSKVVVGQKNLVEKILIGLLCDGHILLEGLPGLAKTLTIKSISDTISTTFHRIQFTPDLLPSDLIGTMVYNQQTMEFKPKRGPIFANIILADEINRAPAKVQSALLEAMAEKQVTIGETTFKLEDPFIVLATQNPLEQEGTYALPEAQLDRFMFKVLVNYPTLEEEKIILDRMTSTHEPKLNQVLDPRVLLEGRNAVSEVYLDEKIKDYILRIIFASRDPKQYDIHKLDGLIRVGGSPRATICLTKCSKAKAFLNSRNYVTPDDVKEIAHDVLRHRIISTFEAEASGISNDDIIDILINNVDVP